MQELRVVLIIVGAVVIAALFLHGLWTSKREKPTRLMGRSEDDRQNSQVPPLYDKDGLGEVRVVKPKQTSGQRKEPELHFTDSHHPHTDSEDALFKNDAFSRQRFDDEQDELPASSAMPSQSVPQMAPNAGPRAGQGASSNAYGEPRHGASQNPHQVPVMSQLQMQQEQMMQRQGAQNTYGQNQPTHNESTNTQRYAEERYSQERYAEDEYAREKYAEERYTKERYAQERQPLASHASVDFADYDQSERYHNEREGPLVQRPNSYYSQQEQQQVMSSSVQGGRHPMERKIAHAEPSPLIDRNASMEQANRLNRDFGDEINQSTRSNSHATMQNAQSNMSRAQSVMPNTGSASLQTEQSQQVQAKVKPNPVRRQPKPTQEDYQTAKGQAEVKDATKTPEPKQATSKPAPQKTQVFCISVQMRKNMEFRGRELVSCLQQQEMLLGEFDIFHRHSDRLGTGKILFSVANMFNPGSFPMKNIHQFRTQGITFFMSLPCPGEAEQNFNLMLQTAQEVADMLGGDVRDHEHNLITPQRIDEYREQIRQFYIQD